MSDEKQQQGQQGQEGGDKTKKRFDSVMSKAIAVLGGEEVFKQTKAGRGDMEMVVDELLKDQKESLRKEVKEGFKGLIDKKRAFDKEMKAKKAEFVKAEQDGMKAFAEAGEAIFQKIENIDALEKEYLATMNQIGKGATDADTKG